MIHKNFNFQNDFNNNEIKIYKKNEKKIFVNYFIKKKLLKIGRKKFIKRKREKKKN